MANGEIIALAVVAVLVVWALLWQLPRAGWFARLFILALVAVIVYGIVLAYRARTGAP